MIAIVFGVGITLLELAAILRALFVCFKERFSFGGVAAVARLVLLVVGVIAYFVVLARSGAAPEAQASPPQAIVLVAALWGGPLTSFVTLWQASRRAHDVPAAQEEQLGRPFDAWLPVALIDAVWIVIQIGAYTIGAER